MINLSPKELKIISEGLTIVIGTFEHEDYMEISDKWDKVQKKIDNYLGSMQGIKDQTKEIRDNSTKLPKKKLKLENIMIETVTEVEKEKLFKKMRKLNDIIFNADYSDDERKKAKLAKSKIETLLSPDVKDVERMTKEIRDTATKLPKKKLKLKEEEENMTSKEIYYAGKNKKDFNFKKGLDELIKKFHEENEDGFYIYLAGKHWDEFDYKKGTNILINTKHFDKALKYWPKSVSEIERKLKKIADKKKIEENMKFTNYLEERENDNISKQLNEDAATFIGQALGYTTLGLAGAFGGTLLVLGGVKAVKGLIGLWKRITKNVKSIFNPNKVIQEIKTDARVNKVKQDMIIAKKKYEDELKYVYLAIVNKDFNQAKEELNKISPTIQNNPDVHKSLITEITKSLKMPPIYITSPGNKSYQAIKKLINIKVARASAAATEMAFKTASSE